MLIGVCEDDPAIRNMLREALRIAGHDVVLAHNGGEALRSLGPESRVDVIVMDIGLPDSDGRDVCQALRSAGQHAPTLFLTALNALHDRLSGFGAGGDDYLGKPFDLKELIVRLEALARRGRPIAESKSSEEGPTGDLILDPAAHAARTASGEVPLTPTEFRVLAAITSRPNQVVRRKAVIAAAWPDGAIVNENTLDSYIRRVRTKLSAIDSPVSIETVRGIGYRVR